MITKVCHVRGIVRDRSYTCLRIALVVCGPETCVNRQLAIGHRPRILHEERSLLAQRVDLKTLPLVPVSRLADREIDKIGGAAICFTGVANVGLRHRPVTLETNFEVVRSA